MNRFLLVLSVLFSTFAYSVCGTTRCFDECKNRYVRVEGNECEARGVWNNDQGCYEARGYCKEGTTRCHRSTYCFDRCYNDYVRSTGNLCRNYYDFDKSCWASIGICEENAP